MPLSKEDKQDKEDSKQNRKEKQIVLDKFQEEFKQYRGHKLLCTGRQVGKTTIMAISAAERMIVDRGIQIIVASLTEDQAKLIIVMTLSYLEKKYKAYICKGAKKPTQNKIELNNGSSIIARPVGNTGDAIRGFTGDILILDEASRYSKYIFEASKPTLLTTGGEIWMCSTPFGKEGYFYECFLNKNNRFKVWHISSEEVIQNRQISESWTQKQHEEAIKFLEQEKKDMTKAQYAQEYMGEFIDDFIQYFNDEVIENTCSHYRVPFEPGEKYILGMDIARMGGDETTWEIFKYTKDKKLVQVENIAKKDLLTTDTITQTLEMHEQYRFSKIYIDTGGIGAAIFDQLLANPKTRGVVEAIDNATRATDSEEGRRRIKKEELYANLKGLMERGEILLLRDDNLMASLRSVQFEFDIKENIKTTIKIFGRYTHIAEGIKNAAWFLNQKSLNLWVKYS